MRYASAHTVVWRQIGEWPESMSQEEKNEFRPETLEVGLPAQLSPAEIDACGGRSLLAKVVLRQRCRNLVEDNAES